MTLKTAEELINKLCTNMIKLHPKKQVKFRPFSPFPGMGGTYILGPVEINLHKLYPNARPGEYVYAAVNLVSEEAKEILITVSADTSLFFEGRQIYAPDSFKKTAAVKLCLKCGENLLTIKCMAKEDSFGFSFIPTLPEFTGMWAKDYLYSVRTLIPIEEYGNEEGFAFSGLLKENEKFDGTYAFPKPSKSSGRVDMTGFNCGKYTYAVTYAADDTAIILKGAEKTFINGIECGKTILKKGDMLTVQCLIGNTLEYNTDAKIGIPYIESKRNNGCKWLVLGGFDDVPEFDVPVKMNKVYSDASGKAVYWRCEDLNTFIRPYLDTSFFGQWFYANMVSQYGLLEAAKTMNRTDYMEYFMESMEVMADFYEYMLYDRQRFGLDTPFLQRSAVLDNLDAIGTVGMCMCEAYANGKYETYKLIEVLKSAEINNVPRFKDGSFRRADTMWADDMFMSCPFLLRLGDSYFAETVKQFDGFDKRLWMGDRGLYSHIWFIDEKRQSGVAWGRGNGWIFITLSQMLEYIPQDFDGYKRIKKRFEEYARSLKKYQSTNGMWHQVLDMPQSYSETSCTAMFLYGTAKGMRMGILDNTYLDMLESGWKGILENAVDDEGNVYGVCQGSGCSDDWEYYGRIPVTVNDSHGMGVIIAAACEYVKLKRG